MKINRLLSALTYDGIKGHFGQFAEDVLVRKIFGKKY